VLELKNKNIYILRQSGSDVQTLQRIDAAGLYALSLLGLRARMGRTD